MILPDASWRRWPGLDRLLAALGSAEGETRFVGGCVRDTLLGLEVSDVDLATRLAPDAVMARLKRDRIKAVPTGLAHGTVTAVIQGRPIQVTTLRRDVATDGRRATIAYTDDWREDAARRDFTINALSAEPASGKIHDYFEGEADIEARRVRFIGDPLTRIAEDHLRILRFFRFHARFGEGAPDREAMHACSARRNDLMALSRERIADELLKLLALDHPSGTVVLMYALEIFGPIIPEIDEPGLRRLSGLCEREREAALAPDPLRRFAALLPPDPDLVASIAARLRLSKKASKRLVTAANRNEPGGSPEALAYWLGRDEAIDRILLGDGDPNRVGALEGWVRPKLPVSGGDLVARGLLAGPLVAATLQAIEREWVDSGFPGDNAEIIRRHVDQALRASQ